MHSQLSAVESALTIEDMQDTGLPSQLGRGYSSRVYIPCSSCTTCASCCILAAEAVFWRSSLIRSCLVSPSTLYIKRLVQPPMAKLSCSLEVKVHTCGARQESRDS